MKRAILNPATTRTRRRTGPASRLDPAPPGVRLICSVRTRCLSDSVAFKGMFYVFCILIFHLSGWERRCDTTEFSSFQDFMILQRVSVCSLETNTQKQLLRPESAGQLSGVVFGQKGTDDGMTCG